MKSCGSSDSSIARQSSGELDSYDVEQMCCRGCRAKSHFSQAGINIKTEKALTSGVCNAMYKTIACMHTYTHTHTQVARQLGCHWAELSHNPPSRNSNSVQQSQRGQREHNTVQTIHNPEVQILIAEQTSRKQAGRIKQWSDAGFRRSRARQSLKKQTCRIRLTVPELSFRQKQVRKQATVQKQQKSSEVQRNKTGELLQEWEQTIWKGDSAGGAA